MKQKLINSIAFKMGKNLAKRQMVRAWLRLALLKIIA